jgi:hypothetical protein
MKNFKSGTTGHIYIPSHAIIKNWQIFRRGKDKTKYHCICLKCGVEKEIPAEMLNDKKFEEKV